MNPEISPDPISRFQVFVKPIGATCNMACRYCYYLQTERLYQPSADDRPARMSPDLLERYIVQHLEAHRGPEVNFSWHGGEPTALGVEYFRAVVELQRKHGKGRAVTNGIQTNGLLIDEEWARFLAAERFRVGLSLDGPADVHDAYRVTRGQQPTHSAVMRAFDLLKRYRVPCDILCVVHALNVRHPLQVYRFFRRIGASYLGFLPLVQRDGTTVTEESVRARDYGDFLCAVFDEWVGRDTGRIGVQAFEEASRPARGLDHSLCIFRETCGDMPVVERNGDFYACDHFVDEAHRVGNIGEQHLGHLIEHPTQRAFGDAKRDRLPRYCRACPVLAMCNGACPKDRFTRTPDGEEGLNYLCEGFRRFFTHVTPWARHVALEEPGRRAFEELLQPGAPTVASPSIGRNDPCPCGSGRKYKRCCGQ
ncbi:MAG: anaerobic sulfatase maturase [Bacteroidales bacterium]